MVSDRRATAFPAALLARPGVRQFIKFCTVGLSSFAIDFIVFNTGLKLGLTPLEAIIGGFICGVSNGFFWNRRWTFKDRAASAAKQGPVFLATNLVGLTLGVLVTTLALIVGSHLGLTKTQFTPVQTISLVLFRQTDGQGFSWLALNAAKFCATVIVTAWNFSAAKFITFKN